MPDNYVSKFNINDKELIVKDSEARNTANTASTNATNALNRVTEYKELLLYKTNELNRRISTIIADGQQTEGNTELIDIRTGADGKVYPTAGDAVRVQNAELKEDLDNRVQLITPINLFDKSKVVYGKYMYGEIGKAIREEDNSEFAYVILPIITPSSYKMTGASFYCYTIDTDRKVIHPHGDPNGTKGLKIWEDTPSAKYIVINYRPAVYPTDSFMFVKGKELPSNYTPYFDEYYKLGKSQYYATLNDLSKIDGETYFVGADKQYKSFIKCIKDLANNNNRKTIYVDGGKYDIFNEIGGKEFCDTIAEGETDWEKYSVIIPPNTTIIGLGNVVFNFKPTLEQIGNGLKLLSPINIQGSCHLENITINASNCRYCIHDETGGNVKFTGAKKTYKNVHCIKSGAGLGQAYASGFDDLMEFSFDNCIFESTLDAFSMHNRDTKNASKSSRIIINNCAFIGRSGDNKNYSVRFGNINWHEEQIKVFISNSYMNNRIVIYPETDYGLQNYDVTMLMCNRNTIDIALKADDTNRFIPKIYN